MKTARTYEELKSRLDELSGNTVEKQTKNTAEAKKKAEAYNTAFWETMHTGMPQNTLKEGSDGSGGFLVPDTFEKKLVEGLTKDNLLRRLGTVLKTTKTMKIPRVVEEGSAAWIPEGEIVRVSETTFGEIVLDAYKLAKRILVSDELLEDADFDVEDFIYQMFVHAIAKAEEAAFFTGDGNGKPLGIIHQAEVGFTSESVGNINYDDVLNLIHSIKSPYRKNAALIMSEDAITKLLSIPHYHGNSPWEISLQDDVPNQLFGYPVYTTNYLDRVEGGSKPILFGDFSYYWIIIRDDVSVKVLNELYHDDGQIGYIAREYLDAKLIRSEAIKVIQMN